MLSVRKRLSPIDYSKCNQKITVYHEDKPGSYRRFVIDGVFFDFRKNRNVEKTGSREANSFLLVIPQENARFGVDYQLKNGDKVLLGEGKEISEREEWAKLIPAAVPNLVVVKYIDVKYWQGEICHVEVGG